MDTRTLHLVGDRDTVFASGGYPRPFAFNTEVASVFDDMASRSIPLYAEVTADVVRWATAHYRPRTEIVDIGCSTGTTLAALAEALPEAKLRGVDTSPAMLGVARRKLRRFAPTASVQLDCGDAAERDYGPTSVAIANYTLQFMPYERRKACLRTLAQVLVPGGVLYMSEKLRCRSPRAQETSTRAYETFKLAQGYSRTEIERKKEALDNVLVPLSLDEQMDLLEEAGFVDAELIMRWHTFGTFVAFKPG